MKKYAKFIWEIRNEILGVVVFVSGVLLLMRACGANYD